MIFQQMGYPSSDITQDEKRFYHLLAAPDLTWEHNDILKVKHEKIHYLSNLLH